MIKRQINYTITGQEAGMTALQFLKSKGYSHRLLIHLKNTPFGLTMGGEPIFSNRRLIEGEVLTVLLTEDGDSQTILPVPLPLSIVYEDEDILVINKDAGVPIHPSQGHFDNTLANAVAWYYRQKGEPFVYRAINRLDRDTTGLLVLAKHMLSACILSDQMVKRLIRREYLALVCGRIPEAGTIDRPIGRVEGSTIERHVDEEHGERAVTHYKRLSYHPENDLSLVSLRLETGRTHQLRVHMASIGYPLPGDFLYNPDYRLIGRQPLHSYKLEFVHPLTGLPLVFTARLPEDMERLCLSSYPVTVHSPAKKQPFCEQ